MTATPRTVQSAVSSSAAETPGVMTELAPPNASPDRRSITADPGCRDCHRGVVSGVQTLTTNPRCQPRHPGSAVMDRLLGLALGGASSVIKECGELAGEL